MKKKTIKKLLKNLQKMGLLEDLKMSLLNFSFLMVYIFIKY